MDGPILPSGHFGHAWLRGIGRRQLLRVEDVEMQRDRSATRTTNGKTLNGHNTRHTQDGRDYYGHGLQMRLF